MDEETSEHWRELVSEIRGSCEWCKSVVYAMHLCELTVLNGTRAPVRFGVGKCSRYEQPPPISGKPATILLARELVTEKNNPGVGLPAKVTGFACVLAHEMAHHALSHEWRADARHADVSELTVEQRRKVLVVLDAAALARTTGLPYDVIVDHWAIGDEAMRTRMLNRAADESDERASSGDEEFGALPRSLIDEAQLQVAEEWGAAVVGCMMSYRLRNGADYAARMAQSVLDDLETPAESGLVEAILMAACANSKAEALAAGRAAGTLENAFNNPQIEQCREAGVWRY